MKNGTIAKVIVELFLRDEELDHVRDFDIAYDMLLAI